MINDLCKIYTKYNIGACSLLFSWILISLLITWSDSVHRRRDTICPQCPSEGNSRMDSTCTLPLHICSRSFASEACILFCVNKIKFLWGNYQLIVGQPWESMVLCWDQSVNELSRGFIKDCWLGHQTNWPAVRMILSAWFNRVEESFSYKEVQF